MPGRKAVRERLSWRKNAMQVREGEEEIEGEEIGGKVK